MDHLTAGTIGSSAGLLLGYPLDLVKVRLQAAQPTTPSITPSPNQVISPHGTITAHHPSKSEITPRRARPPGEIRLSIDTLTKTVRTGGLASLFAGSAAPLAAAAPTNAAIFGAYGIALRLLTGVRQPTRDTPLGGIFLAGGIAGGLASLITTPAELVKCRLQNQGAEAKAAPNQVKYRSSFDCLKQVAKQGGVVGLYRGFGLTGARDFLGQGLYFSVYQWAKRRFSTFGFRENSGMVSVLAGGTSGLVAWTIIHPLDVIKSRVQIDGKSSWGSVAMKGLESQGIGFFAKGLPANLLRAFPVCGTTFIVYEGVMRAWPH